nr:peptidylprolyl isomerase [Kordiimonas marina]
MQEFIVAEVPEPDDATLRAFYQAHQAEFTPPKQYAVRTLFIADSRDRVRLGRVEAGLKARVSFAELASKEGQAWDGTPPKAALPEGLLVRKLGPSGAAALPTMKVGETMGPFEAGHGVYYLHLADVKALPAPAFESARTQVLADWRRLKNAEAMKAYIAKLRAKAEIDRQGGEGTAP